MNRLTSDNPKDNFGTMLNLAYGKDGWAFIRRGDKDIPIQDFVIELCKEHGCETAASIANKSLEEKDNYLCECAFECCPRADVYAALCGFCHVRDRLKLYEDAGIAPPGYTFDAGEPED